MNATSPMFPAVSTARASFTPGTLYAVDGGDGRAYYAQATPTMDFGFFRFRSRELLDSKTVLESTVMCRIGIDHSSVGRALRQGKWQNLGRAPLHESLLQPLIYVQWPVGTSEVTVWRIEVVQGKRSKTTHNTTVDDPTIQHLEIAASWDAICHLPERLKADYGREPAQWHIGGPIWRERKVAVEMARRHPTAPFHRDRAQKALLPLDL
jgi:hypothetical protein